MLYSITEHDLITPFRMLGAVIPLEGEGKLRCVINKTPSYPAQTAREFVVQLNPTVFEILERHILN